jgi:hypothetical protein
MSNLVEQVAYEATSLVIDGCASVAFWNAWPMWAKRQAFSALMQPIT